MIRAGGVDAIATPATKGSNEQVTRCSHYLPKYGHLVIVMEVELGA